MTTAIPVLGRRIGPFAMLATILTLLQLGLRAWVGYRGYFSLDDFVFYTRAAELPLFSRDLLFDAYNGHLMPGGMVWAWLVTRAAPLSFGLVTTTSLLLQLALDVAMLVLLRRLFGDRPAVLVPYALFLFSTISLPGFLWWAAALNQLPQQLAMVLALTAHLGYTRTGRTRLLLVALACLLAGLAFSEKTALVVPLMFGVSWLFGGSGTLARSFLGTVRRHWVAWAAYTALLVPYAVYYVTQVSTPVRDGARAAQAVDLLDVLLRRTILPGLLGGPWTWEPVGWVDSLAAPPVALQVVAAGLVAAAAVATIRRRTGAYRGWLLAGLYLLLELVLLLLTRVQVTGVVAVGAEYRYVTDFALVAALAAGFAILPTRRDTEADGPVLGPARRLSASPLLAGLHVPTVAVAGITALLLSATYSAYTFGERWTANPARPYLANARVAVDQLGPDAVLYNGSVPSEVVWRLLWPANLPTRLLTPVGLRATPLETGMSTRRLLELNQQGRLQDSQVTGFASKPGTAAGCGWSVGPARTAIPLATKAFSWNWVVQLDLLVPAATTLTVSAGKTRAQIPVAAGQRRLYLAVEGEVAAVSVHREPGGEDVCVKSLVVGLPQPAAW